MKTNCFDFAWEIAKTMIGQPYIWGGDDPMTGYDCSGFVIEVLRSCGVLPNAQDFSAAGIYDYLTKTKKCATPKSGSQGCFVFWKNASSSIVHIEMCINEKMSIGASGGGSANTTIDVSKKTQGYVKVQDYTTRKGSSELLFVKVW